MAEPGKDNKEAGAAEKGTAEVSLPVDEQRALLIEGPPSGVRRCGNPPARRLVAKLSSTRKARLGNSTVAHKCVRLCGGLSWVINLRSRPATRSDDTEVEGRFDPRK